MENTPVVPVQKHAVVATGVVTERSEIVTLADREGKPLPIPLFVSDDMVACRRMKKRLERLSVSIEGYDLPESRTSRPLFGIVPVWGAVKTPGPKRQMTDEQKRKMQEGRKRANQRTGQK